MQRGRWWNSWTFPTAPEFSDTTICKIKLAWKWVSLEQVEWQNKDGLLEDGSTRKHNSAIFFVYLLYMFVCYLSRCVLWLVSDRASCSEESASWEPNLLASPGFLAGRDMGELLFKHQVLILFLNVHNQTHPSISRHPHCGANVPAWTCIGGGGVVTEFSNQVKPEAQMRSLLSWVQTAYKTPPLHYSSSMLKTVLTQRGKRCRV